MADTGGLQWFQLKPSLKERAPLISDDRSGSAKSKIHLEVWLVCLFRSSARGLTCRCERKMTEKAGEDLFLKKISRSATVNCCS